jgi:DNA end-binding protein Ku
MFWKGYLKLSLVTCAVAIIPATSEAQKVRFHTLNRRTGNRVESRYVDGQARVDDDDLVKGYQTGDDQYVMVEDDELEAVALESARTIDIEMFAPKDSIEWIWYDRPHYLAPDDAVGTEAFSVIREAMKATGTVGISRLVLYRRERAVMLEPRDDGIVLWTLRYGDEVRDPAPYFSDIGTARVDAKLMSLAKALIQERLKPWNRAMVADPIQTRLLEIIAARKKATRPAKKSKAEPARPNNVVNIMDALRKSLAGKEPRRR